MHGKEGLCLVIISALLSRDGTPAKVLRAWLEGRFDLIVSLLLLEELGRALAYPKLAVRISAEESAALIDWLRREALLVHDPNEAASVRSEDPGDDYLVALTEAERAALISGDRHVLALTPELPALTAWDFVAMVGGN
ncbi:MAG: putative toxin-antitoxin system toxin component, PIN family [Solirubrobacterales bacterium]